MHTFSVPLIQALIKEELHFQSVVIHQMPLIYPNHELSISLQVTPLYWGFIRKSVAALSSCIVLSERLDLPVKWLGPQQKGQGRVNIKKGLLGATLQHPLSFVTAQHKSGHWRVNRCGLMGLGSHDTTNEFKKESILYSWL